MGHDVLDTLLDREEALARADLGMSPAMTEAVAATRDAIERAVRGTRRGIVCRPSTAARG